MCRLNCRKRRRQQCRDRVQICALSSLLFLHLYTWCCGRMVQRWPKSRCCHETVAQSPLGGGILSLPQRLLGSTCRSSPALSNWRLSTRHLPLVVLLFCYYSTRAQQRGVPHRTFLPIMCRSSLQSASFCMRLPQTFRAEGSHPFLSNAPPSRAFNASPKPPPIP